MEEQCYPLLKEFKICAFKEKDRAKLKIIHIPTSKERKFDCVHSVTTMSFEDIEKFKTDSEYQKQKLAEMEMISEEEFEKHGITCDMALNNAKSYAQGLSELSEDANPLELFDLLIELDKNTIGTDYPLNSEIAKFMAKQKPELKGNFLSYLKEKHREALEKKDCRGIITDAEKFFGENEKEKVKYLLSIGCNTCKKAIYSVNDPYFIKECYDFIKKINLNYDEFTEFPVEIVNLKNLQWLDLSSNRLTKIPKEIGNLQNLQKLDLYLNQLTNLPKEIGNLKNLQVFNLSSNQLTEIPKEIGNLKNLKYIYLYGNELVQIPKEIENLKNLRILNLGSNKLTKLPNEIGNLQNLQWLDLERNKLVQIPKEIGNLENLEKLNLDGNQLTELPKEIGNLENLQKIDLYWNRLTRLPKEIGNLKNIRIIDLSYNQLAELPNEIGNLQNLQKLKLNGNQLTDLPKEIGNLKNLQYLYLNGNQLTELPKEFCDLAKKGNISIKPSDLCK